MDVSIVIRTYNESRHLPALLAGIDEQSLDGRRIEVVVVDSGSTDATVPIARERGCHIVEIAKSEFTFGRSLNVGCEAAAGSYLVFASGHCVPASNRWIVNLVRPLEEGSAAYTYGRQIGNGSSRFSERQHFRKYFPEQSRIPQDDIFCNNANAAVPRAIWQKFRFDESLTGLEDMEFASRLIRDRCNIGYVADAPVYHLHEESWHKVRIRYEREAMALQQILPQVHVSFLDFLRYLLSALMLDFGQALQERVLLRHASEILLFRLMQFWGAYRGNHEHRRLSREMKERYFYPK